MASSRPPATQLPDGPLLRTLAPMLLTEGRPFSDSDWIAELKYDGIRLMAEAGPTGVLLKSRNGADATRWFPEIVNALAAVKRRGRFVVDGEIAVLDEVGRADFERTMARMRLRGYKPGADLVVFCIFDLLVLGDKSVMGLPLMERKTRLSKLMPEKRDGLFAISHFDGADGMHLYQQARALKLEGVVYERKDSLYLPGERSEAWVKAKRPGATPARRFSREPM